MLLAASGSWDKGLSFRGDHHLEMSMAAGLFDRAIMLSAWRMIPTLRNWSAFPKHLAGAQKLRGSEEQQS